MVDELFEVMKTQDICGLSSKEIPVGVLVTMASYG
jgi:hypothetical protein